MIMRWLFLTYVILNPMFYLIGAEPRSSQEFFFQISSLFLIIAGVTFGNNPIKFSKLNISFSLLAMWFVIIFLIYHMGWSIFLNLFLGLMVYCTLIRSLKKEDIKFVVKGILLVCGLGIFYLAFQYFGYDFRGQTLANVGGVPTCSFFNLNAAMGMYFAMAIALSFMFGFVGLLILLPLVFSWSTAAYLGAIVTIMFFCWIKKRIIFWISLIPILAAFFCFVFFIDAPMGMFQTRIPMWGLVIQDIHKSPVTGFGLDSFRNSPTDNSVRYFKHAANNVTIRALKKGDSFLIPEQPTKDIAEKIKEGKNPLDFWDNPHNEYVWISYETGFIGLILALWGIYELWQRFRKSKRSSETTALLACLIAFGIFSLTQFPFHLARIGHLFPIVLGLFYISTEEDVN